jgi:hypothetical protein
MRMFFARVILVMWLAFSTDNQDDYYGVLSSIRRYYECWRLVDDV